MLENVGQMKLSLAGGSAIAVASGYRLFGALLGGASGVLNMDNVAENVANFGLFFKTESSQIGNVCSTVEKSNLKLS